MNRRLFALLALVVALVGCRTKELPHIRVEDYQDKRRNGNPIIRVACVGDSITYGAGIEGRETNSYPAQLGEYLGAGFTVRNFGRSGATLQQAGDVPYWTTDEFRAADEFQPDVVILKLGTNDTKPQNWKGKPAFIADYKLLLEHYRHLKSRPKLWVCLPVPVYGDQWGINAAKLDEVIEAIQEVCDKTKIPVIDLNDALSGHPEMFPDKIHPDALGAILMAKTVYQAIRP